MREFKKTVFLTEEEYELAETNGVSREMAFKRVNSYGWDRRKAVTRKPITKRGTYTEYVKRAVVNGINKRAFYHRIDRGWDPEKACTEKARTRYGKDSSV